MIRYPLVLLSVSDERKLVARSSCEACGADAGDRCVVLDISRRASGLTVGQPVALGFVHLVRFTDDAKSQPSEVDEAIATRIAQLEELGYTVTPPKPPKSAHEYSAALRAAANQASNVRSFLHATRTNVHGDAYVTNGLTAAIAQLDRLTDKAREVLS